MSANIHDIQVLGDLKTAFGRFGEDVVQILASLEKQLEEIQESLTERQRYWGRQIGEARDALREAKHDLHLCYQASNRSKDGIDCSSEEERVSDAEKVLTDCEENLETTKKWRHRIESQIDDFQSDMHRLSNLALMRTGSAQEFLANKIEILNRYVSGVSFISRSEQLTNIVILPKTDNTPTKIREHASKLHEQNKNDKLQEERYLPIKVLAGAEIHHIATDKNRTSTAAGGPYTPKFEALFEKAGMSLKDPINKLPILGHQGPHPKYNRIVYQRLRSAVKGLNGFAYEDAFQNELYAIAQESAKLGSELNRLLIKK